MIAFRKIVFLLLGIFLNISAHAAIIYNSTNPTDQTIALGINPEGHLNTTAPANIVVNSGSTGIARKISGVWRDATSPGCWCEGWGVSGTVVNTDGTTQTVTGYADVSVGGVYNLQVQSFTSDTLSISSTVWIKDASGNAVLEVTHKYGRSAQAPNVLFQGTVTITNISGKTVRDVRYNRSMDWDVPTTEFNEVVSHTGVAASVRATTYPRILYAGDNGFMMPNPLNPNYMHYMNASTYNTDFYRNGPNDHGSSFTFQFGDLTCGSSSNFMIYYGAAADRTSLVNALTLEGVSIYSIGETSTLTNPFCVWF